MTRRLLTNFGWKVIRSLEKGSTGKSTGVKPRTAVTIEGYFLVGWFVGSETENILLANVKGLMERETLKRQKIDK